MAQETQERTKTALRCPGGEVGWGPSTVFCQWNPQIRALLLTCGCNLDIDHLKGGAAAPVGRQSKCARAQEKEHFTRFGF